MPVPIDQIEPEYDMTTDDLNPHIRRDEFVLSFSDTHDNEHLKLSVKLSEEEYNEFHDGILSLIDRYK